MPGSRREREFPLSLSFLSIWASMNWTLFPQSAEGGRLFTQSTESNASLSQKQRVTSYLSVPAQLGGHRKLTATISDFYMDTNGGRVSPLSSPLGVANGMSARARGVGDGACHLHTLALEGRVLPTPHGEKP